MLLHQFHDIIPGSSIHEVYEDSHVNYGIAEERADRITDDVLKIVTKPEAHMYSVYTPIALAEKSWF